MKISKLQKFAWVFFALALGTTTVFAQGWRNGNRAFNNQKAVGLNWIQDLTKDQKAEIDKLREKHFDEMAELRNQRSTITDPIEKIEIRSEMLKKVAAHRNKVKSVLTPEQQGQYEAIQLQQGKNITAGQQRGYNRNGSNCRGTFKNQGNVNGYGPGFRSGNRSRGNGGCMGNFGQGPGRNGRGYGRCINSSNS